MRTQLMGGQFLDVLETARGWDELATDERVTTARRVIRYKSAKYTIEHPLLIGAAAAGVSAADLDALSTYGLDLGEAFQLRDDVLGVFGDPTETGKPAGDDLREGKLTVLVALTLDHASQTTVEMFDKLLGLPDLDEPRVDELRGAITASGALDRVEQLIQELSVSARTALHSTTTLSSWINCSTRSRAPLAVIAPRSSSTLGSSRSGRPSSLSNISTVVWLAWSRVRATRTVSLPSRRSSPAGLPVSVGSPKTPSTSSRSWKASPRSSP